jgi:hypothetical protein
MTLGFDAVKMNTLSFSADSISIGAVLCLTVYSMLAGIRLYRASGFRLYMVGYVIRVAILMAALLLGVVTKSGFFAVLITGLGFLLALLTEMQQIAKVRQTDSQHWKEWEMALHNTNSFNRLLLR